jgi:hypothetical protein
MDNGGGHSHTQQAASDSSDEQLEAPETALSPQDAQWLAGANRMAGATARTATEAAARARTAMAMSTEERLEKRRSDQQARRKRARQQNEATHSSGAVAESIAAVSAADVKAEAAAEVAAREANRKAERAARARQKYAEQQRQKRAEQHRRELPERQALVDAMREMLEDEIASPRDMYSKETYSPPVSTEERCTVLFEEMWGEHVHFEGWLAFDKVEGRSVRTLAEVAAAVEAWKDPADPSGMAELAQDIASSVANIIASEPDQWTAEETAEMEERAQFWREYWEKSDRLGVWREWPGPREFEEDAAVPSDEEEVWGKGSADCYYYRPQDDSDGADEFYAHVGEDEGSMYERWCDANIESMRCTGGMRCGRDGAHASSSSSSASSAHASSSSSGQVEVEAMQISDRHTRAKTAGQPPRRAQFSSDERFRAARERWYHSFTGRRLFLEGCGSLADQQRAFDAVARSWRAYSDGRRSFSASPWDGRMTETERRMNGI